MKKIVRKFWGVALAIMLLSSLFVFAAPAGAADPLNWEYKAADSPSGTFWGLAPNTDVIDYDIAADGLTAYAVVYSATNNLYYLVQSTSGGASWTDITNRLPAGLGNVVGATIDFVAMAPDDPSIIVIAASSVNATAGARLAISANGGSTWTSMGAVGDTPTDSVIFGLEVSAVVTGGIRYVSVYGTNAAGTNAAIYVYNYGAGIGTWRNAMDAAFNPYYASGRPVDLDSIVAFKFSPNFPSDYMAVLVSANVSATDNGTLRLHLLQFSGTGSWDAIIATGFPVTIAHETTGTLDVNAADIALGPEYMGGDESARVAFVGVDVTGGTGITDGVWRCTDSATPIKIFNNEGVYSLAYDGVTLAAGAYNSNNVWRTADPLSTTPSFLVSRTNKEIGIDTTGDANDLTEVKYVGETLYGAKRGTASAFSKSTDNGLTWNDFALLDSGNNPAFVGTTNNPYIGAGTIDDIYVTGTGDPWYMAAHDGTTSAIFRMAAFAMTRVLVVAETAGAPDFILRGIESDSAVVYAADEGGQTIYYTSDGGVARWQTRLNVPAAIKDMAVESSSVIYIGASGSVNVYKSINQGFTWGPPTNTKLGGGGNINTILSLAENQLVVGGTLGGVAYSTDGGTTWTPTFGTGAANGAVQVAASGLSTGSFIFAAPGATNGVYRCEIGPSNPVGEFKTMGVPASAGQLNTGLVLKSGVLYAVTTNGTTSEINRSLRPTAAGTHSATGWGTRFSGDPAAADFGLTPSALKAVIADSMITLYAVDKDLNMTYYFQDTVALVGPTVTAPANGALIAIVSQLVGSAQPVNFLWNRLSVSTGYEINIALDADFTQTFPPAANWSATDVDNDSYYDVASPAPALSLLLTGFVPGNTYHWRIRASTPLTSAWSEARSFTVEPTGATVPTINAPVNGVILDTTSPAFSWSPVSGATKYAFEISELPGFETTLFTDETSGPGEALPVTITLERGKTYFWRVRALEPVEGDWSTVANFSVAELTTTTTTPASTTTIITIPPPPAGTTTIVTVPPPPPATTIAPAYIWAIIIIGAILVIAVIVLIVRTRRSV